MFDKYFADFNKTLNPLNEVMEINKKAFEKLSSTQSAYFTEYFNTLSKQSKALLESKDIKSTVELQLQFAKDAEARLANTLEQNLSTLTEAREAYMSLVEKQLEEVGEFSNAFDLSKFGAPVVNKPKAEAKPKAPAAKAE
ncbi:phasin family protein [Balneatrix alpica]|uniref:Phasin family protein n=1 Tax=Balneatrix alpica TaxID=75684 RepID=A0ABV5Z9D1_9GAMM|nr:phasin family protein [Balneatrix alpica]